MEPRLPRRALLRHLVATGAVAATWPALSGFALPPSARGAAAAALGNDLDPGDVSVFTHMVASGDPTPSSVVLWTHVRDDLGPTDLVWEVARDPGFTQVAASGETAALPVHGNNAKVDVADLPNDATWYYRFTRSRGGERSAVGRTRTLGSASRLRFAATTCTNPAEGELNTLTALGDWPEPLDFVLHLGDYVYEFSASPEGSAWRLEHYRGRHADWRGMAPQLAAHRMHPWVVVWDDGDIWNGASGFRTDDDEVTGDHDPGRHGSAVARRRNAIRAFFEWVPARDHGGGLWGEQAAHCHRRLELGPLADLTLIDTRTERDLPLGSDYVSVNEPAIDAPDRRIMSPQQFEWMASSLGADGGRWTLLGSQHLVTHWGVPGLPSLPAQAREFFGLRDQGNQAYASAWNGYAADRQRLYDAVRGAHGGDGIRNLVTLSGDAHFSIASDLADDPMDPAGYEPATGRGSIGTEFMVPSVSSAAFPEVLGYPPRTVSIPIEAADVVGNPHHQYAEFDSKGFLLVDLTPRRANAAYWYVDTVREPSSSIEERAVLQVRDGSKHVSPVVLPDDVLQALPLARARLHR